MADRIVVLDVQTANQIAAGEVVERPASVVKELLENAIDASATVVEIDVVRGGFESITVRDDGEGMTPADALRALQRHATSKIRTVQDLQNIHTFGFRGEALPSIASVSRMEIYTRTRDSLIGTHVQVEGGELVGIDDAASPIGTQITVCDLFYNTPARRKHQKSESTEVARILEVVHHCALARPDIAFRLLVDHKRRYQTSGQGRLLDVIAGHHGLDYVKQLIPVSLKDAQIPSGLFTVDGYIGSNQLARANRQHQVFLVNGRSVQSDLLRHTLERAYDTLLPLHRYPVAVLRLQLPPAGIDVNIHPNKQQVRFVDEKEVQGLLSRLIKEALQRAVLIPQASLSKEATTLPQREHIPVRQDHVRDQAPVREKGRRRNGVWQEQAQVPVHWTQMTVHEHRDSFSEPPRAATVNEITEERIVEQDVPSESEKHPEGHDAHRPPWKDLQPVGQILRSYIVCDGPGGVYIIDQHAAHERIYYEQYARTAEETQPRQLLAVPIPLELSPAEWQFWLLNRSLFEDLGFIAEEFGEGMLMLREVPVLFASFPQKDHASLFRDILDEWVANSYAIGKPKLEANRARIILASCKAAIKANDPLSLPEMKALIDQLASLQAPYTCPHGRPTLFQISAYELAKHFKRV